MSDDTAVWKKNSQAKQRRYARGEIERLANEKGQPQRSAGRHGARRSAAMAKRLDLQARIWQMLVAGEGNFQTIAQKIGVSRVTAWRYAIAYANRLDREIMGNAKAWRAMQASQIQEIKRAHWPKKASKASADVILRAMERESKLLGLDREPDTGIYTGQQVKVMLQGLFGLFVQLVDDGEARRQFALGIRRTLPAAVKSAEGEPVIDIEAAPEEEGV